MWFYYNESGIDKIVNQQFDIGKQIADRGLVPILEPEVDIHCPEKEKCEQLLLDLIMNELTKLKDDTKLIFKLTIPSKADFYMPLINHPKVVRVVALSGGYSREQANEKLAQNQRLIASISRRQSHHDRVLPENPGRWAGRIPTHYGRQSTIN